MLLNLHVKNLALIRECDVEFTPGLNILTGETGAGKSILLGSVQLALGGKMSREMIREDAGYGLVELVFSVRDQRVQSKLAALSVQPEDGLIVLSRKIMDNRSICRINGETSTMAKMKQVGSYLLDIHGQHEHQSLLYKNKQLEILDDYGKEQIYFLKEIIQKEYKVYSNIKKQLSAQDMDEEQRKREMSFLEFEIQEIQDACLLPGEDEQLEQRYQKLNNSRKIAEALGLVHQCTGYDQSESAGEQIGKAIHGLSSVSEYDVQLKEMESQLGDIDGLLNDFNRDLSVYLEDLIFQEEEFHQLEERLDCINNLKAKYGNSLEAIGDYQLQQQNKLEELRGYEQHRSQLKKDFEKAKEQLDIDSGKLSDMRKEYAKKLEKAVILQLKDLNFLDVKFQIHFYKLDQFSANGVDDVEYGISTNPGEPVKSLGKVVSGGELSRIMLAIKTILADQDEVETLIFDEIDTGISGRTAQKVSEKMARIGLSRQVLCITHLPQIASMADTHFLIEKQVNQEQTITRICPLSSEDSVGELARLLGGAEITDTVYKSALEMKELAQKTKNARLQS